MNADIKQQWMTALRSGAFTQGHETLRPTENTYCCLGVLCELHRRTIGGAWGYDDLGHYFYLDEENHLPDAVVVWADLPGLKPVVGHEGNKLPLWQWNDLKGLSFARIADLIEVSL